MIYNNIEIINIIVKLIYIAIYRLIKIRKKLNGTKNNSRKFIFSEGRMFC